MPATASRTPLRRRCAMSSHPPVSSQAVAPNDRSTRRRSGDPTPVATERSTNHSAPPGQRGQVTVEQGAKRVSKQELWRLVGATQRLRLAAHSMTRLMVPDAERAPARDELSRGASELVAWYGRVAEHVGRPARDGKLEMLGPPPLIDLEDLERAADHRCVALLWVNEHLRHLSEHGRDVVEPANHVAEQRRAPWWH